MKCKNCGATIHKEVREGVFQCEYCHSENQLIKEPVEPIYQNGPDSKEPTNNNHSKIDFNQLSDTIVRIQSENGSGTGFFIHEEGYVLTNAHVVLDQPFVRGFIGDSPIVYEFEVKASGTVMGLDLALIELLEDASFNTLPFAENHLELGETVFAIGNPKNLGMSISKGTISRIKENEYQLDMTLNPGNSGGPVINEKGEVVGIVSYLLEEVNGLSFAINLKTIQTFLHKAFNPDQLTHASSETHDDENIHESNNGIKEESHEHADDLAYETNEEDEALIEDLNLDEEEDYYV